MRQSHALKDLMVLRVDPLVRLDIDSRESVRPLTVPSSLVTTIGLRRQLRTSVRIGDKIINEAVLRVDLFILYFRFISKWLRRGSIFI